MNETFAHFSPKFSRIIVVHFAKWSTLLIQYIGTIILFKVYQVIFLLTFYILFVRAGNRIGADKNVNGEKKKWDVYDWEVALREIYLEKIRDETLIGKKKLNGSAKNN